MDEIKFEFSLWNDDTEHYDYAQNFSEAVTICEIIYGVTGAEWKEVKESNDLYRIELYMSERGYEAEVMS
jgi:hypothetical protein